MARRGRPKHPDVLTPREWDVLALLREGCTNEQIATRLEISVRTARYHVSEILGKLEVTSREDAARWQPNAAPTPGRALAFGAPLAFVRRLDGLGAGARVAAGGLLAVAAVGVGLLAWGVMRTGGSGGSDANAGSREAVAAGTAATCGTPSAAITPGLELGASPIFWRFGLTTQDLTSGHYCGRDFKVVFRVANEPNCVSGQPGPDLQVGNVATGQHLTAHLICVTTTGDLPGTYFVTGFTLPSAGEWRLQVRFGQDFSTQTIRIGGTNAPQLAAGPEPPCAPPQQQPGGGTPMSVVLVDRAAGHCHVIPTADRLMQAKWVQDGKTFVAYDFDTKNFGIYDINGTALQAIDVKIPSENFLIGGSVSPSPDGRTIFIERDADGVHTLVLRDVGSGQDREFPQPAGVNGQAWFSPDGKRVAYDNNDAGKTSLIMANAPPDSATREVVRSVDSSTDYIDPLAWSPDGAYLLIMSGKLGAPCVGSPDPNCHLFGTVTYEVISTGGSQPASIWKLPTKRDSAAPPVSRM